MKNRNEPYTLEHRGILYSAALFYSILLRERAMTLRCGHYFSLIEITLPEPIPRTASASRISNLLSQRLRETDIAGWINRTALGIILPATRPEDAETIANQLAPAFASLGANIRYSVHVCPPRPADDTHPATDGLSVPAPLPDRVTAILFAPIPRWKRGLDIALAGLLLIGLSPVLLLIALGIEIVSPGPLLFFQTRIGHLGIPFNCCKFRSMRVGADQRVHQQHVTGLLSHGAPLTKLDNTAGDKRLIPFGKLLRASGLDELPQLINVLRGEMSLIGPRPCVPYEYAEFSAWHHDRCTALPGITGLWQVNGKNRTTFEEMMRLDVQYSRCPTLKRDLSILFRTPLVPVSQLWQCMPHVHKPRVHASELATTTQGAKA